LFKTRTAKLLDSQLNLPHRTKKRKKQAEAQELPTKKQQTVKIQNSVILTDQNSANRKVSLKRLLLIEYQ